LNIEYARQDALSSGPVTARREASENAAASVTLVAKSDL